MIEETVETKGNGRGLLIVGGILLALLLAGAAFVGGRLIGQNQAETADLPPGFTIEGNGNIQTEGATQSLSLDRAAQIPDRNPDATGLFVSRVDDTITIGTGNIGIMVTDENAPPEYSYDGITVEILVTNQTEIYEDVTEFSFDPSVTSLQQKVQSVENLDNLDEGASLQVWGRREGDRIIAEIVLVSFPMVIRQ